MQLLHGSGDAILMVWTWLHFIINECTNDGIIAEKTASTLMSQCEIRAFGNMVNDSLPGDIPFAYAQVASAAV